MATLINNTIEPNKYLDSEASFLAFLKSAIEVANPSRYNTNEEAIGAAALIQGYVALLGFGRTLTKNHINEDIPTKQNIKDLIFFFINFPIILIE